MTERVLLIRHGEVEGDAGSRFLGRTDVAMSAAGEARIARLSHMLAVWPIEAVWCSPLRRSRRTAALIAAGRGIPVRVAPALAEIDMGDWENLSRREVARSQPAAFAARGKAIDTVRPPGGESFADLAARVLPCWRAILASPEKTVAVAGHAGVDRVILCDLLGMPLANLFRLAQPPGCVDLIEIGRAGPVVAMLGATAPALLPALSPALPPVSPAAGRSPHDLPETPRCWTPAAATSPICGSR